MKTSDAPIWVQSFSNELGRLANGIPPRLPTGTNTIKFIPPNIIPHQKTITYGRLVVDIKHNKPEKYRTRLTAGGNLLPYSDTTSTPTASIITIKLLFNSVLSTPSAKFCTIDIQNFYLNTTLPTKEYMKLPLNIIPPDIIKH